MTNALDPGGQDVQQESAHKLCAVESYEAFATVIVSTNSERHLAFTVDSEFQEPCGT